MDGNASVSRAGVGWISREALKAWLSPDADDGDGFALAILRDLFAEDADVLRWLAQGRREFHGRSASDMLRDGRARDVESLLVRLWNRPLVLQPRRRHYRRKVMSLF